MKRHLALSVIMGLLAWGNSVAKANLLSNGNLDNISVSGQVLATPTGWIAAANRSSTGPFNDGLSSEGFANVADPGGYGVFFKPFQGQTTNKITASLYQDNAGTPGLNYTLTGWAGAGASYIGLTDPTVKSEFHLKFFDSANNLLADTSFNLAPGLAVPNANPFNYKQYTLSAIAPAGTATVRSLATMVDAYGNPAGGDQAFVVDVFDLEVPEPSAISLSIIGLGALI